MGVNIVDPNSIITSDSFNKLGLNGIPDLSSMYIFVELTAQRRSGSVLVSDGSSGSNTNRTLDNDQDSIRVNMMGFNEKTGYYTTQWTNNSRNNNPENSEGFGITEININTNSSYVPTVDIEFVDIRGSSLFKFGGDSKYAALFSFPPPIFTLTVKGYYGKALKYKLHLVRQSTKFDSNTGNYYISANFVAQKYAPLTDILFKYIDIVPLIGETNTNDATGLNFNLYQKARNTRELIERAKRLYDDLKIFKTGSKVANDAEILKSKYLSAQLVIDQIQPSLAPNVDNQFTNTIGLYIKDNQSDPNPNVNNNRFTLITSLSDYDNIIKRDSPNFLNKNIATRLYVAVKIANQSSNVDPKTSSTLGSVILAAKDNMGNIKDKLLASVAAVDSNITSGDISDPNSSNSILYYDTYYVGIDITNFYIKLYQQTQTFANQSNQKQQEFKNEINAFSAKYLGQVPTIGYIFSVLCNDVDNLFTTLAKVGDAGEKHHDTYRSKLISSTLNGGDNSKFKKITAFPTVKKVSTVQSVSNGSAIIREERAYPDDVFTDVTKFPETQFVDDFINAFLKLAKNESLQEMRDGLDDQGNSRWIPINPLDTEINGNITPIEPYVNDVNRVEILNDFIQRFYIQTQFSYGDIFYKDDSTFISNFFGLSGKQQDLIKFLSESEASNMVNSINDTTLLQYLQQQSTGWKGNVQSFYNQLDKDILINGTNIYKKIDGSFIDTSTTGNTNFLTLNSTNISRNRYSSLYKGFDLLNSNQGKPVLRNNDDGSNKSSNGAKPNVVDTFLSEYANGFIKNIFFTNVEFDTFTKENIIYTKDKSVDKNPDSSDFCSISAADGGVPRAISNSLAAQLKIFGVSLSSNVADTHILSFLTDTAVSDFFKAKFIVSLFGKTYAYFDTRSANSDGNINSKFAFPSIVEVPNFAHLYMGSLAYFFAQDDPSLNASIATDFAYIQKNHPEIIGTNLIGEANYQQQIKDIGAIDQQNLVTFFTNFVNDPTGTGFGAINNQVIALINEVNALSNPNKSNEYYKRLTGTDLGATETNFKPNIVDVLTTQLYIINYTQYSFYPNRNIKPSFRSLADLNADTSNNYAQTNAQYFTSFFSKLNTLIGDKLKDIQNLDKKFQESIADKDVKLQTYYSFKSLSDRWILGFGNDPILGKVSNVASTNSINTNNPSTNATASATGLYSQFKFIDRAGNDISDKVVIDFSPLIELSKDYDVSVYTVMSRLLSLNGFEFFPLQNFFTFDNINDVNDMFKISSTKALSVKDTPAFVCMYIGGTSSNLDDSNSSFPDDGVKTGEMLQQLQDFSKSNVTAFKVAFAKQNQSIFTNIELNTNEHKETNESLAILSNIAQDQSASTPVPKAQNLFSTYEQRSYSCKVEMLGDIMIQPTQYFILENVPMFLGAYLILQVQHNITANHMKTSFNGVRIRRFPQPFVTDFATSTGVQGGGSDQVFSSGTADSNNVNNINTINPITNDQTSKLLSP